MEKGKIVVNILGLEVREPTEKQQKEIIRMILKKGKATKKGMDVEFEENELLNFLIPMLTNLDKEDININKPDLKTNLAIVKIQEIVVAMQHIVESNVNIISSMSKEEQKEIGKKLANDSDIDEIIKRKEEELNKLRESKVADK